MSGLESPAAVSPDHYNAVIHHALPFLLPGRIGVVTSEYTTPKGKGGPFEFMMEFTRSHYVYTSMLIDLRSHSRNFSRDTGVAIGSGPRMTGQTHYRMTIPQFLTHSP